MRATGRVWREQWGEVVSREREHRGEGLSVREHGRVCVREILSEREQNMYIYTNTQ